VQTKEEKWLAVNVRRIMDERGLSFRALADLTGVNYGTLHSLVSQQNSPRVSTLVSLSQSLGISVEALLEKPAKRAHAVAS